MMLPSVLNLTHSPPGWNRVIGPHDGLRKKGYWLDCAVMARQGLGASLLTLAPDPER